MAILGGRPAFSKPVVITKPTMPPVSGIQKEYGRILKSGMITNAQFVREFEQKVAKFLSVKDVVAVSSCTSGLMLTMKIFGLKGEVIVPSFTFHATAHAAVWNGLKPVFVDCDPNTYNIDIKAVEKAITPRTSAILAVHIFGNPCRVQDLQRIARKHHLKLIFDAAHGFGAQYKGRNLGGFGDAEVFSLSPTKLLTAGEGGMVATNDRELAKQLRIGRNYGDSGSYDSQFSGFNARMSEFHAILGIESLKSLEKNVNKRNRLAQLYKKQLSGVPGITFQHIDANDRSSFKDFSIVIDGKAYGLNRDRLAEILLKENIVVKKYFYPPVHMQKAFAKFGGNAINRKLVHTNAIAENILSLPLYSHMTGDYVRTICSTIKNVYNSRTALKQYYSKKGR